MADTPVLTRDKILEIAGAMPAAPRVFADLSRLLRDANSPLEEIAELIKHDATLTAHIIRVSNSAVYRGERSTGSVEEAVGRIGYQEIFQLTGYVAGVQLADRALKHYGIEAVQLRQHMLYTAFVCEQLAPECRLDARQAYTAGLIRPLGLFVCDRVADRWPGLESYHPARDQDYLAWASAAARSPRWFCRNGGFRTRSSGPSAVITCRKKWRARSSVWPVCLTWAADWWPIGGTG
jgi:HD-like signal output (HDOD) protein